MSYDYLFKLIIIGDTGVGKSCLLLAFIDQRFRQKHEITIGVEFGAKMVRVDGQDIKLQIWDTAGQESFKSITRSYYRSAAGALVIYDITSRQSFNNCIKWLEEAKTNGSQSLSFILVGNKTDLDERRQVSFEEGQKFAKDNGLEFLEASAKDNNNVEEVFLKISMLIYEKILNKQLDPSDEKSGVKVPAERKKNSNTKINKTSLQGNQEEEKKQGNGCC